MMKIKTKTIALVLLFALLQTVLPSFEFAYAARNADIFIDGESVLFDNPPKIIRDSIYIPLSEGCRSFGITVGGSDYKNGVYLSQGDESIWIQQDNVLAKYGGEPVQLSGAPQYIDDVFYIPIDCLEEAFGYKIDSNIQNATAEVERQFTIKADEQNVAVLARTSNKVFDGVNYDVQKNNANLASSGYDYLSSNPSLNSSVLYRFDISEFADAKIKSITLNLYAIRNWAGDPTFRVYSVSENWDTDTVNYDSAPEYNKEPLADKTYSTSGVNKIEEKNPGLIELNITDAAKQVTAENPYINIMIKSSVTSGSNATAVCGVNTDKAPRIVIKTKINGSYTAKNLENSRIDRVSQYGFDNVKYLNALGILRNSDELPFDLDEVITRAEFVNYLIRVKKEDSYSREAANGYDDVTDDTDCYSSILKAVSCGYLSGSGSFRPDDSVKLAEACKMLVDMLGNSETAQKKGGWPYGYIRAAAECGILDETDKNGADDELTYTDALSMIAESLTSKRLIAVNYSPNGDSLEMSSTDTILKTYYDAYLVRGVVTANEYTSLTDSTGGKSGKVTIGDTQYSTRQKSANGMLAMKVKACVSDGGSQKNTVIYLGADGAGNNTLSVEAHEISGVEKDGEKIKLRYVRNNRKEKSISITKDMNIIYNGCAINKNKDFKTELFFPKIGYAEFIDTNAKGEYNTVIVTSYKDILVSSADYSNGVIYDKYRRINKIETKPGDDNIFCSITDLSGNEYTVADIKANDVLSAAVSKNGKVIDLRLSRKTVSGSVESISALSGGVRNIVVGGYHCRTLDDDSFDIYMGQTGIFYLDVFGYIAGGEFNEGEKQFAYLIDARPGKGLSGTVELQLFTKGAESNAIPVFKCADRIKFNEVKMDASEFYEKLLEGGSVKKQPVCFKINSKGALISVDTVSADVNAADKLVKRYSSENGDIIYKAPYFGGKYIVDKDTFIVSIPNDGNLKDEYFSVTNMRGNSKLKADIYSVGADKISAGMIVLKDYGTAENIGAGDYLAVVKEMYVALGKDETAVNKVLLSVNGVDREESVRADEAALLDGVNEGDVVRYTTNLNGEIKKLDKYYDSAEKKIIKSAGVFNDEVEVYGGFAYYKENGYVRIVSDYHNTADTDDIHILDCNGAKNVMYKYNPDSRNVEVQKATYDDIVDYKSGRTDATGMLCQVTYGNQYRTVILIDLGSYTSSNVIEDDEGEDLIMFRLSDSQTVYTYKKAPGNTVVLPDDTFSRPFSKIIAWSDGTNQFPAGSKYTIPDSDVVLTPVWGESPEHTYTVTEGNAALIDSSKPDQNVISLSGGINDEISSKSTAVKQLLYRIDASDLIGRDIGRVKLILSVCRNWAGDTNISVYNVLSEWTADSVSYSNKPAVSAAAIASTGVIADLNNTEFSDVEIDITKAIEGISSANPYINIMVASSVTSNLCTLIKSINSTNPPIIKASLANTKTVSFAGGDGADGSTDSVKAEAGETITLPACGFTKDGYSFAGWSDGKTTYPAGGKYTVGDSDICLTAQWTYTGIYTIPSLVQNSALVSSLQPTENLISNQSTGEDGITTSPKAANDDERSLFYKFNVSNLIGKNIKSAKLVLTLSRNWNSYPKLSVYSVTQNRESGTICYNNMPQTNSSPIYEITYNTAAAGGSASNPFANGSAFAKIEIDVAQAFSAVTESNPYISLKIDGTTLNSSFTKPVFKVKGVRTSDAPVLLVEAQ